MRDRLELILHPVRLRITHAMSGGRTRTTADLCASIPDVSKATIYRHVALLVEGGVLEVAGERRARGAVERSYRLHPSGTSIDRDEAASMSLEQHRDGFAAAIASLVGDFNAYLDRPGAAPFADGVSYAQAPLWLTAAELRAVVNSIREIMTSGKDNAPAANRNLYLFSPILFPIESLADSTDDDRSCR